MTKNGFKRGRNVLTTADKIKLAACFVWIFTVIALLVVLVVYYG